MDAECCIENLSSLNLAKPHSNFEPMTLSRREYVYFRNLCQFGILRSFAVKRLVGRIVRMIKVIDIEIKRVFRELERVLLAVADSLVQRR